VNKTLAFVINQVDFVENLGIPFLSATAKQLGWHVELFVFDQDTIDEEMRRVKPDLIGYSVMSSDADSFLYINNYLKNRYDFISIMGGPHPTYFPDVRLEDGIDYICRGEGEVCFAEFLTRLERHESVDDIPNLGSAHFLNPLGDLIADLDSLPMPDRDLTFQKTELGQSKLKLFCQSRGCPFSCSYCFNNPLNQMQKGLGKSYRFFSPERVCAEINELRSRYPLTFVKFQDDLFCPKTDWLQDFCTVYQREVNLPFYALERLDLIDEERIRMLKEANCRSLGFAIDSSDISIRKGLLGRGMHLTNEEIIDRLRMVRSHGIYTVTNFILGVPQASAQIDFDGTKINSEGRVTYGMSTILVPYPGTAIYNNVVEKNLLDEDISDLKKTRPFSSIQKRSVLNCFTAKEKDVQFNLSVMYPVLGAYPRWRPFLYFLCRHLPPNPLFVFLAVLEKGFKMDQYVYPTHESPWRKLKMFLKARRLEKERMWGDDIAPQATQAAAETYGSRSEAAG
jgi:radical SAM superfamily enzyme YgiQ (UPF0313 family)